MHHIRDKRRWWAVNFCRPTVAPQQNAMFDLMFPLGLLMASALIVALTACALYYPAETAGVSLANVPTMTVIKDAIEGIGRNFEEYKKTNDDRIEASKKGNEALVKELDQKLAKISEDLDKGLKSKREWELELKAMTERLEELEARASNPAKTAQQKNQDEYKSAFIGWVRNKGQSAPDEQKMSDLMRKDVTIGSAAGGGYAVPEEISRDIELLEKKISPVRNLVKVVQVGTSDYKELVNIGGGTNMVVTSGWVGESTSRPATSTPGLREVTPAHGELYAYPQASEWSLDDMFFSVENWLTQEAADAFAYQEADAVIRGNGSNKPKGMTNQAPAATADWASPLRHAEAYEYVESNASPDAILPDKLIDLVYKLNRLYRANGVFTMNSATTGAVRKLKDQNDQYLWQPGLANGQPNSLLGYRLETWEQMDDVGTNKFPVAFGDFKRGYLLTTRTGIRITKDQVTNIGFIKFYIRRREGGIPLNNDAIKLLKTT